LDDDDDFFEWPGVWALLEVEACDEREFDAACDGRDGWETMADVLVWPGASWSCRVCCPRGGA
jgi:hypothetical protein